ncbi:solute carrier family 12 member 4-like protein [Leptotrombidium deliense]|uniref:Solute carrier family 12 member 4-like protein n=1 Tax=Leptotrombidium deliense TaxID=299467 RepID=A0A443SHH1_9ACAR|nr:solute carrier family 12 member 4-like protein [Leptotrombidium deliense]
MNRHINSHYTNLRSLCKLLKFHVLLRTLSLTGVFLCLFVMFISSWYYAIAAMFIAGCIYKYIEYRGAEKEWGDGFRGLALSAARYSLLRLEEGPPHTKNWRPQIMVFAKVDSNSLDIKHKKLFAFSSQLKAGKGLTLVCTCLEGEFDTVTYSQQQAAKQSISRSMNQEKVKGFSNVLVTHNVKEGMSYFVQAAGLGGLRHNCVVIGWPQRWRQSKHSATKVDVFLHTIKTVISSKLALLIPKGIDYWPDSGDKLGGYIDVWWIVHDGGLLMLLPFLLKQHKTWKNCPLRIFTVAQMEDNSIQMKKDLKAWVYALRIEAEVEVIEIADNDISAYTYERTLRMEQRTEMLKQMQMQTEAAKSEKSVRFARRKSSTPSMTPSVNLSDLPPPETISPPPSFTVQEATPEPSPERRLVPKETSNAVAKKEDVPNQPFNASKLLSLKPDESNVRRMNTAVKLNEAIVTKSHSSKLVILNLPGIPKSLSPQWSQHYMEFLEVLTEGLERVLMVRGGGREVITIYS